MSDEFDDDCQFLLLDCEEPHEFYGPFETFEDAVRAADHLTCERWQICDDSSNLKGESLKQERLRETDKHEAWVWDRHRITITKKYHFQIEFRRCHEDPNFRAQFIAAAIAKVPDSIVQTEWQCPACGLVPKNHMDCECLT